MDVFQTHRGSEEPSGSLPVGLIREMRPWQWYKQGIMLIALLFSVRFLDPLAWTRVVQAMVAWSLVASSTYIVNDISDVAEDRRHPVKRHRPIASGLVGVPLASAFAGLLLLAGLVLGYLVQPLFLELQVVYLVQNVLYNVWLRDIVLVDVLVIASGFVLRAMGGVVAVSVVVSPWLILATLLLALLLALGKRRHELENAAASEGAVRPTLREYTPEALDQLIVIVMTSVLVSYSLYTFFQADQGMMLTLPFAYYGIFRYNLLVHQPGAEGEDAKLILKDLPSLANGLLWILVVVAVLLHLPGTHMGGLL